MSLSSSDRFVPVFPAPGTAPGCQIIGVGVDTPAAPYPTHHRGATVGNLCPQARTPHPSSPQP